MPSLSLILPFLTLATVGLAALLTLVIRKLAFNTRVVDEPVGGRKIHQVRTALWGGLATGITVIVALLFCALYADGQELRMMQLIGFAAAILILMIGGAIDDRYDLPPAAQFIFPLIASLVVVATGSGILQISNPAGSGALSLVWSQIALGSFVISLPADILTILWLLTVTYAMKFLDGLDGLAAGMAVISGLLIAALASSNAYFQPLVAAIALLVAAAHLGFLPFNKQGSIFLGEAGSTIAGFSLGVLAIISGAKLATAATALGLPLVDIVLVVGSRLLSGQSPFKGDGRHLHFRLLNAGLQPWTAVRLIWAIALTFGLVALTLQTRGKLFLFAGLVILVCVISVITWLRTGARKSGKR